jgi:hypothetical protein
VIAMLVVAGNLAFPHVAGAVEVQARLERDRITAGESTTLEVTVEGSGGFADPELQLPAGLELLGSARAQSFSWVNGKSTSQTVFRYELGAGATGTFTIGPARVRAGSDTFSSAPLTLEVLASAPNLGGGGGGAGGGTAGGGIPSGRVGPAALLVDVTPREPWIGQPVTMRVRLVQRQGLAEDPRYGPPSTTGFWAEPASRPASYYAQEGDRRVLVTETRSRLYPLAAGVATIGSAAAELILASGPSFDPLQWPGGGRRRIEVRSDPVPVRVRPLPGGAPPGFDGAVGSFGLAWSADRERTSQDVALTVRFDVRGLGNLPMIHTPVLACDDCEVFVGTVEDSLSTPDSDGASRRSFRWTVLPRRTGAIEIPPPRFAWFDPVAGSYRRVQLPVLAVEVDPALAPGGSGRETFPSVFSEHPVGGEARPARAWAWALGGLLLGSGLALWRVGGRKPADAADRARQREWLRAARLSGPDFWRAAEEATAWLEQRGRPVGDLRGDIAAARYASGYADPEAFRGRLTQALEVAIAPPPSALPLRLLAVVAALAGVALLVAGGPRWGSGRAALDAHAADAKARAGDVDGAQKAWRALWDSGTHAPGLAARLAWAELRAGSTAAATLWAMRGERGEPRDQALRWSWERVRESGGLLGAGATRMPVRSGEWAVAALLLGILAGWLWPGWRRAAVAAVLVLVCAAAGPVEVWRAGRRAEAVVRSALPLDGGAGAAASGAAALELTPGQVVRVLVQDGARVRVIAGRDIVGWVPASAVEVVE